MGVSGCGKTTIGRLLSNQLRWDFIESDDYHSPEDVRKMSAGIPLTDHDRWPWLERLNQLLLEENRRNNPVILACSALSQAYRNKLTAGIEGLVFVYLKGDYTHIHSRMQKRKHFMGANMLASQFDVLEEPCDALVVDISLSPQQICDKIQEKLSIKPFAPDVI